MPPNSTYAIPKKNQSSISNRRFVDLAKNKPGTTSLPFAFILFWKNSICNLPFYRNEKLTKLNLALREQLEESQQTNESLTNDLQKLACDWQQMRDEMVEKEEEWKEEEQVNMRFCNFR